MEAATGRVDEGDPAAPIERSLAPPPVPPPVGELSAATRLAMHRAMVRVRALDEKMVILQRQGRIRFYGPITGQEASTIGAAYAIRPEDWVFPALREAGVAIVRGLSLAKVAAQCFGNELDTARGRQMPCHYVDMPHRYYAMSSSIGSQLPHAVGCAHASLLRGEPVVTLGFLGDGASSEGDFHAAMNFAGVYRVPCVLCCQNNRWAITVPFRDQTRTRSVAEKAVAYGFGGVTCDGNDILDVYETIRQAVESARGGGGPQLVECRTYRVRGHTTSDDPRRYRDEAEVEPWRARDPIRLFEARLLQEGVLDAGGAARVAAQERAAVEAAIDAVEGAPPPPLRSLIEDVTAEVSPRLESQLEELERVLRVTGHDPMAGAG